MVKSSVRAKKRLKKEAVYRSFAWQKSLGSRPGQLRSPGRLWLDSWRIFRSNLVVFSLLGLVFICLAYILFLSASPIVDLGQLQEELRQRYGGGLSGGLSIALAMLPDLFTVVGQYLLDALVLFAAAHLVLSLALWWMIRRLVDAGKKAKIRVRDALYFGPSQFVPFTLLAVLLSFQLLPFLIAADFAAQLRDNGTLQTNWEQAGALAVVFFIGGLCLYWLIGGLFSLIVGSLPGTRPFEALRASWQLTHRRRTAVIGRLFFMFALAVLGICLLSLPFLALIPRLAEYFFYLIALDFFILGHIYCYLLYSDLLKTQTAKEDEDED